LKGDDKNPYVEGYEDLLSLYNWAVKRIMFSGPTHYSGVLDNLYRRVKENRQPNTYYLMVIVTDGCLHDLNDTKNLIVEMSKLPVSIIIVGLGDDEFESMKILDADQNVLLNDKGEPAVRDIVQFVDFKEFDELALTEVTEELL
jgi:hypothetical protein